MYLNELEPGACATIMDVENREEMDRLMAMGVCRGRVVELTKRGNPLIIKVFGSRIGMSQRLARHIRVEACAPAGRCWMRNEDAEPERSS